MKGVLAFAGVAIIVAFTLVFLLGANVSQTVETIYTGDAKAEQIRQEIIAKSNAANEALRNRTERNLIDEDVARRVAVFVPTLVGVLALAIVLNASGLLFLATVRFATPTVAGWVEIHRLSQASLPPPRAPPAALPAPKPSKPVLSTVDSASIIQNADAKIAQSQPVAAKQRPTSRL